MKPSPSPAAMTLLTDEQAKAVSEQVLKDNLPYSIKLLAHYILASRGTRALTEEEQEVVADARKLAPTILQYGHRNDAANLVARAFIALSRLTGEPSA